MENAYAFTTALQAAFFMPTRVFPIPGALRPCLALKRIKTSPVPWSPSVQTRPSAAQHSQGNLHFLGRHIRPSLLHRLPWCETNRTASPLNACGVKRLLSRWPRWLKGRDAAAALHSFECYLFHGLPLRYRHRPALLPRGRELPRLNAEAIFDNATASPEPGLFSKSLQLEELIEPLQVITCIQASTWRGSARL